jgi:hypothetical protein
MTVEQLIAALQRLPKDAKVYKETETLQMIGMRLSQQLMVLFGV